MRARLIFTANLIALAIFCISAFADERQKIQLKTSVDHVVLSSELKEKIPDLMERALIPGLSMAVIRDGKILMNDSSYVWIDQYKSRFSGSHNRFARLTPRDRKTTASAGATLYTTALDFAKFVLAIINDIGMRKPSFYEMLHPQIEAYKERTEGIFWGLGFGLNHTDQGKSIWHWGDNGEFKCYFEVFKPNQYAISAILGTYSTPNGSPEEIWQEDGKLYAGRNRRELVAESNDTYWFWDGRRSYRINFERDNKGSVIGYRIQIGDQTFEGKKLK
jgi:CubicO group peptidase (beta-lactamase class C family)